MSSTFYGLIVKMLKTCDISGFHRGVNEVEMPPARDRREPHISEERYLI
jgi:hypothetical protein